MSWICSSASNARALKFQCLKGAPIGCSRAIMAVIDPPLTKTEHSLMFYNKGRWISQSQTWCTASPLKNSPTKATVFLRHQRN